MTLEQLVRLTLSKMEEEGSAEHTDDITVYLNECYMALSRDRWPVLTEVAATAVNGMIPLSDAPAGAYAVARVDNKEGRPVNYGLANGAIKVADGEYTVVYRTPPKPMADNSDSPEALPETVHPLMADFAAYRMLMRGGSDSRTKGQLYYAHYLSALSGLIFKGDRITNKY